MPWLKLTIYTIAQYHWVGGIESETSLSLSTLNFHLDYAIFAKIFTLLENRTGASVASMYV